MNGSESLWVRFWHKPIRAEGLAAMRICLALSLLTDQLFQYLPNFAEFFGPGGVAPAGLHDRWEMAVWRVTYYFFGTDDLTFLYSAFGIWMAAAFGLLLGWHTRSMNVIAWFLTRCFIERNPTILSSEDDVLQGAMFLLMLSPSGAAFSLDALRKRGRGLFSGPAFISPWSVRVIQLQLCLIYCSTGLIKLKGNTWGMEGQTWFTGTWWDGTSMHYFLNDPVMCRRAFAEYPVPFWITAPMTYFAVWWEATFPLLVANRWTRAFALLTGIFFHIGIFMTVEVGWFGFYTLSMYPVWIPDSFWERFDKPVPQKSSQAIKLAT